MSWQIAHIQPDMTLLQPVLQEFFSSLIISDIYQENVCTIEYTHAETESHTQTHTSGLSVWPHLVNYFPLEMNQPAAVWLVWLPPNQTVIWLGDESGRVEHWGKPFALVQPRAPHYDWMNAVTPNVKPPPPTPRYFPGVHKSCGFFSFSLPTLKKASQRLHLSSWDWC